MLKSFGDPSARSHCRIQIKLCLILGMVAVQVASAYMIIPSAAAAQAECDCSNIKALQTELRNAMRLQQAFRNKIAEFRKMGKAESTIALKQFAEGEARQGIEPVPGYNGPSEVDYHPWGRDLYDPTGTKHSAQKLCSMAGSATARLDAAVAASACPGIGKALRAHEAVHLIFCVAIGFFPYEEMHGADRAQEEVEAYGAQIKVLRAILDSLRCGYRASAKMGDTVFSGIICSFEKPFTIKGSNPVMTYPLEFTPSSGTAGTWSFKATTSLPITAFGSGTYTVEGANTEAPRLVISGGSTGIIPHATVSGGGSGSFDLLPLDTNECGPPQ